MPLSSPPSVDGQPASWPQIVDTAGQLGAELKARQCLIVCAESCTGGLVAAALTAVAGSSAWFDRGFVTYSNAAKVSMLGVDSGVLEQAGAVSEAVACQMAEGALRAAPSAQLAISTTGVAGPGGGTPNKPVGMVCFGVAWHDGNGVRSRALTRQLPGDRAQVRAASVLVALHEAHFTIKTLL